jgi:hypothetical protein
MYFNIDTNLVILWIYNIFKELYELEFNLIQNNDKKLSVNKPFYNEKDNTPICIREP